MRILEYYRNQEYIKNIIDSNSNMKCPAVDFYKSIITADFSIHNDTVVVCLSSLYEAQRFYDSISKIFSEENITFYPTDEILTPNIVNVNDEFKYERIEVMKNIAEGKKQLVVTHTAGLIRKQFSKDKWIRSIINLKKGDIVDRKSLIDSLLGMGYVKTYTVDSTNQFSVRGSIIDIFVNTFDKPVRIDFFDDEIDVIKIFDPQTQLSIEIIDSFKIIPASEVILSDLEFNSAVTKINDFINSLTNEEEIEVYKDDLIKIIELEDREVLHKYISLIDGSSTSFINQIPNKKVYLVDEQTIHTSFERLVVDLDNYCDLLGSYKVFELNYFHKIEEVINAEFIRLEELVGINDDYSIVDVNVPYKYSGDFNKLTEDLKLYNNKKTIIFAIGNKHRFDLFRDYLNTNEIEFSTNKIRNNFINLMNEDFLSVELPISNLIIYGEDSIYEHITEKRNKYKQRFNQGAKISNINDLNIGDFIVHYGYGIGKYTGVVTREFSSTKRDYLKVDYAAGDSLYIPVEQLSQIQKYSANEGAVPKLTKLGTKEWEKTKARVKKKVNDISEKLLKIYAEREASIGYKFNQDSKEQESFEKGFPYDLTRDQYFAIQDVKRDMESIKPMDRIICGDVGYGKTEVAMRAAFKAVMDGKQVCYLAPTTLLSQQHFKTFMARFDEYGVVIEVLNRFVTGKQLRETLRRLEEGKVDIVIGTHRLLSKDIIFKDLGLLIVDEEQRFGVEHKERIKEMRVNVDTLTLTATPIPRTLQMSIMGIKDLSTLDSPPKNRHPVQTYVTERNKPIIRDAINKELGRNGQVFYLYNKVEDIDIVASELNNLFPYAKIRFAHGKVDKKTLEKILEDFINHKYDILVTTTIIETGIDIPNANTIIIHDADRLGLSQLYQIRGRVGRSNQIAYAYLMFDKGKILNDNAAKRLKAIKEFSALGSGIKIAKRDLAIRGAGDVLGSEQSGFIDSVGIDIYLKLLQDAIKERQGIKVEDDDTIATTDVLTNRSINTKYIEDDSVKLEIHKKIGEVSSIEDIYNMEKELNDRFGEIDKDLEDYIYEIALINICKHKNIHKEVIRNKISLTLSEELSNKVVGDKLFMDSIQLTQKPELSYRNKEINIKYAINNDNYYIKELAMFINKI